MTSVSRDQPDIILPSEIDSLVFGAMMPELTAACIDVDQGLDVTTGPDARYVQPTAQPLVYTTTTVSAAVRLNIFSYPGLSLLGSTSFTATALISRRGQRAAAEAAITAAAQHATETFIGTLP